MHQGHLTWCPEHKTDSINGSGNVCFIPMEHHSSMLFCRFCCLSGVIHAYQEHNERRQMFSQDTNDLGGSFICSGGSASPETSHAQGTSARARITDSEGNRFIYYSTRCCSKLCTNPKLKFLLVSPQ